MSCLKTETPDTNEEIFLKNLDEFLVKYVAINEGSSYDDCYFQYFQTNLLSYEESDILMERMHSKKIYYSNMYSYEVLANIKKFIMLYPEEAIVIKIKKVVSDLYN
jgi:hypothetical protein